MLLILATTARSQDISNELQQRIELQASYKPLKHLKLTLNPEVRFSDSFTLDKYHIEGGAEYKLFKFMSVSAAYRFIVNPRDGKTTEYFNRYFLGIELSEKINRFEPQIKIRYSNYADDDVVDKKFMRYKASLGYDIKKCKITPIAEIEAFHDLSQGNLYKMRYTAGAEYKIKKNNYVGVAYNLDYYLQEYTNKHIVNVSYKFKF